MNNPKGSIRSSLLSTLASILNDSVKDVIVARLDSQQEDAFAVCDLAEVRSQYKRWTQQLPRVEPFYAVKCNSDANIVRELVNLGIGFDCASRAEIDLVLSFGVSPSKIIYANPCKQPSHIRHAAAMGVMLTTVDNADELRKLAQHHPHVGVVFRLLPDDSSAVCRLGNKFGAKVDDMPELLKLAKELNLNVVGTSFHCGSGCRDPNAYADAVHRARKVFDMAESLGLPALKMLDIGGGFPGAKEGVVTGKITFEQIAECVRPALDLYFPEGCGVQIIAEPGRYFCDASTTIMACVIARRPVFHTSNESASLVENSDSDELTSDSGSDAELSYEDVVVHAKKPHSKVAAGEPVGYMYYVNDGLYQSFNCIVYDHATVTPYAFRYGDRPMNEKLLDCSVWGPTCDGLDKLCPSILLPELNVGDWVYFPNVGAYTTAAASNFNGFEPPKKYYINASVV